MCVEEACGDSCRRVVSVAVPAGVVLGVVAVDAAHAVAAHLGTILAVAGAVLGGAVAAAVALTVLRLRRRRAVVSRRVLRSAAVSVAAVPAAGTVLALAAGTGIVVGIVEVAAVVLTVRTLGRLWAVHRAPAHRAALLAEPRVAVVSRVRAVTPRRSQAVLPAVYEAPAIESGLLKGQTDPAMRARLEGVSAGLRARYGTLEPERARVER